MTYAVMFKHPSTGDSWGYTGLTVRETLAEAVALRTKLQAQNPDTPYKVERL